MKNLNFQIEAAIDSMNDLIIIDSLETEIKNMMMCNCKYVFYFVLIVEI